MIHVPAGRRESRLLLVGRGKLHGVPRSLASALSPSLGGALLAAGWLAAPLVVCGALKIAYDLALLRAFRGCKMLP